jgi:hydroxymethylbilane synthase
VIGARGSALSRIQAQLVGAALERQHAGLEVRYAFSAAPADLPYAEAGDVPLPAHASTRIGAINRDGGFALHLHAQLETDAIDLAVHSWKDLPLPERGATTIAATLPRADSRDVLVFSRAALEGFESGGDGVLRVLSCSERRRTNLRPFLDWALPFRPSSVAFPPVRGDIERRLAALLAGDGHALVVAKAALDRMLTAPSPRFDATRDRVRAALEQCRIMVVPLAANPAAPGQGALAIEVRRDRDDLRALLEPVNDAATFRLVQQERARLAALGDDDTPVGITALDLGFGDVEFVGGEFGGQRVDAIGLRRHDPLPRPRCAADLWCGDAPGADPFRRVPLESPAPATDAGTGLLVARADALPAHWTPHERQCVWTPGLATWRKLASRGIWVNGSDESLGETAAADVRHLFPALHRWIKLSHDSGFDPGRAELLPTYRLERVRAPLAVHEHTHFFWNSGSQFLEYLRATPGLERAALHGGGPGNTLRILRATLGEARVRPFLSAAQFRAELCA